MNTIDASFHSVSSEELSDNFIDLINNKWMLITAGDTKKFNTMTASWGSIGVLWNKPIAICFIRPTRYTYEFANRSDIFTLSFFPEQHRKILNYCGSKSGRYVDKIEATGLEPLITPNEGITFEQARLCIECRKIYVDDLKPGNFLLPEIDVKNYPKKDYHRIYIGEILNCYTK
jgi:flavin reductase (DIM6/NTAB) family NADH-FMN oxidoreductase RutF